MIPLNIILLPDGATTAKAIGMSTMLGSRFPTEFVLNDTNTIPHVSIYQPAVPQKNLEKVKGALRSIAQNPLHVDITLDSFMQAYDTFVWWMAKKTPELLALQKSLIAAINPLREGMLPDILKTMTNIPPEEQEYIKQYGYPTVGNRYMPHITITRAKDPKDTEVMLDILQNEKALTSFAVKGFALARMGDHGTVKEILQTFSF